MWHGFSWKFHEMSYVEIYSGRKRSQNLWKCHDILMEFNRIFMRQRHPRQIPWECHEIPVLFNGIKNFGSFWWHFYGKNPWNCHGIWCHFRPKLRLESMMAFYYDCSLEKWHGISMEFGIHLDQTTVDFWHEVTRNIHENPCHIFYREGINSRISIETS